MTFDVVSGGNKFSEIECTGIELSHFLPQLIESLTNASSTNIYMSIMCLSLLNVLGIQGRTKQAFALVEPTFYYRKQKKESK